MIKSSKNLNVRDAEPAVTANSVRLEKVTIDFRMGTADASVSLGQDDGSTFTPTSSSRTRLDVSGAEVAAVRSALETAMKKTLSERLGFQDADTSVIDR